MKVRWRWGRDSMMYVSTPHYLSSSSSLDFISDVLHIHHTIYLSSLSSLDLHKWCPSHHTISFSNPHCTFIIHIHPCIHSHSFPLIHYSYWHTSLSSSSSSSSSSSFLLEGRGSVWSWTFFQVSKNFFRAFGRCLYCCSQAVYNDNNKTFSSDPNLTYFKRIWNIHHCTESLVALLPDSKHLIGSIVPNSYVSCQSFKIHYLTTLVQH